MTSLTYLMTSLADHIPPESWCRFCNRKVYGGVTEYEAHMAEVHEEFTVHCGTLWVTWRHYDVTTTLGVTWRHNHWELLLVFSLSVYCSKRFTRSKSLKIHLKNSCSMAPWAAERELLSCLYCDKTFKQGTGGRERHMVKCHGHVKRKRFWWSRHTF